jgi:hypothetical protein
LKTVVELSMGPHSEFVRRVGVAKEFGFREWRLPMKLVYKCALAMAVCTLLAGPGRAGPVTMTFEGLKNFEGVADYYNGGTGSLGTGPGPAYGVTFDSNALAYIPGQQTGTITPFPFDPSPPTVLLLANLTGWYPGGYPISTTMNVARGFTQALTFYYVNITSSSPTETVQIFSNVDGTGAVLAKMTLPASSQAVFVGPDTLSFTGTAYSVVFSGGNDQLAFDNISLLAPVSSVPEPGTLALAVITLPFLLLLRRATHPVRALRLLN